MRVYPPPERVALGLLAACGGITAPMLLLGPLAIFAVPVALVLSAGHAFVFALPAYLLLRRWIRITYRSAALCGFLIGAVPVSIQTLWSPQWRRITSLREWWDDVGLTALTFGVFGLLGGLIFRRVLGPDEDLE